MGRKIFVSYKYGDAGVYQLGNNYDTRARHYVDLLQEKLAENYHINKGEEDGEDLSAFKEESIESRLRDKIFDSSVTIVLISKNMKTNNSEADQWIPWEISYSLKEHTREERTSRANAILGVVVPDEYGNYDHFIQDDSCPHCNCRTLMTDRTFSIIGNNILNKKNPSKLNCHNHYKGNEPHTGDHSYIHVVKWHEFILDVNNYVNTAVRISENAHEYNIRKTF